MLSPLPISGPLTLGDLLDRSFRIYQARFGLLILTAAIFLVPLGILSGIFSGGIMTGYLSLLGEVIQNPEVTPDAAMLDMLQANQSAVALSYLLVPLGLLANVLVTLALTSQAIAILHNQELSLIESLRTALRRFWAFVGMSIVKWLAIFLATSVVLVGAGCIFFAIAFAVGGIFSASGGESIGNEMATIAGLFIIIACLYLVVLLLMAIPAAYLTARWVAAVPGIVDQSWGPMEALSNSWALTRGQIWRCFFYVVLLYLFYFVLYAIIMGLALAGVAAVFIYSPAASGAVYGAVNAILPVLWSPLSAAAFVLLYYDLRVRQEGYDLSLRVQQLEAEGRNA
jgi:hypothetical protein